MYMGPHMGPKRLGNTNNVVACPMRVLHSTTQTEYQLLETPPVCLFVKRAFPANLMVLKFAALSNCAKPMIVNVVGYTYTNIDQIKSRETEAGNYLTRGRIRDKSGKFLDFATLGRNGYSIARRGQDCEIGVWFAVQKPPTSEVRLWVYEDAQIYYGQHQVGGSYAGAKTTHVGAARA